MGGRASFPRRRRRIAATLGATTVAVTAALASSPAAPPAAGKARGEPERPLVMTVVIDGLDGDAVDAGKAPFITSLLLGQQGRATYFPESRAVMPTVTNANHASMMTGSYSGNSGIAGNEFAIYAPLEHDDSCVATGPMNFSAMPTKTTGESHTCPVDEMTFEAIKRQGNPDGLVSAVIFGKPKPARLFAGRNIEPDRPDADYIWAPCASGAEDDEYCASVPTNPITGYAVDDAQVMDEVVRALEQGVPTEEGMQRPDFTFASLHQVDSAGHGFTPGAVYDEAIAMADDQIERLVGTLKSLGEWERSVIVLLSDHSFDVSTRKVNLQRVIEAGGVPEDRFLAAMGDNGMLSHIYLADRRAPDRFELLRKIREVLLAEPSVAEALYRKPNPLDGGRRHTIDGAHPEWEVEGPRSGDVFVTAKSDNLFAGSTDSGNAAQGHHGSSTTRDNFFAVIGGSRLVRHRTVPGEPGPGFDDTAQNPKQAENVDVAATVMGLLGLFEPEDNEGRFLRQAFHRKPLRERAKPERPELRVRDSSRGELTLRFQPKGGTYDLKAHVRGTTGWRFLERKTEDEKVRVNGPKGKPVLFRMRSISAAGVKSRWDRVRARFPS